MLFDLDGTLTDPREGITACIRHALRQLGEQVPEASALERFIGPPLRDGFAELLREPTPHRVTTAIHLYRERFVAAGMYENRVYDGIPECLEALRRAGLRLYVATSKPTVFAQRILQHFALRRHFEAVYGSELDGSRSGKAEILAYLLGREALAQNQTVMVGDRRHDVEGARVNGVACVAVAWGFASREELVAAAPDAIVKTPAELTTCLRV